MSFRRIERPGYVVGSVMLLVCACLTGWFTADQYELNSRLHDEYGLAGYSSIDTRVIVFGIIATVIFFGLSILCMYMALETEKEG